MQGIRASLKRHLQMSPDDADAYYLYGLCLSRDSAADNDQVESLLKQGIALNPKLARAHFQLGVLYAHDDDYRDAAHEFEATIRLTPEMSEAHYRLALAYKKSGHPDEAEREMRLFRATRKSSTGGDAEGEISIGRFLSVIHPSGLSEKTNAPCPRSPE